MDQWIGKFALVTGASMGIGEAIAKALVHKGVNVMGIARREEELKNLSKTLENCKGSFYYLRCDLQSENDVMKLFKFIEETYGGIDILINNAGMAKIGEFEGVNTKENVDCPFNLYPASKYALRAMADNLRLEIADKSDNIRVTTIYPGAVRTGILPGRNDIDIFGQMPVLESQDIADSVIHALSVPFNVQIEDMVVTALHTQSKKSFAW